MTLGKPKLRNKFEVVLFGDFNQLRNGALLAYPLQQVVNAPTRGAAVVDKIYTSLKDCVVLATSRSAEHWTFRPQRSCHVFETADNRPW